MGDISSYYERRISEKEQSGAPFFQWETLVIQMGDD
jgi:hypothetical protein